MSLVRGPFDLKWGDNVIQDVEEVNVEHTIATDEFETVQGKNFEVDGAYKVSVILTLLATDLASLAIALPQHFVPNQGTLSTGEKVNNAQGAIDIKPGECDASLIYNNLDVISCANPGQVLRIVNARTKLEGVELDSKLQKVMVKFVGESDADEATIQMFKQGTIAVVS